jgi:transposase-like protein
MRTPWFILSNAEIMQKDPSGNAMRFVARRKYSHELMIQAFHLAKEMGPKEAAHRLGVEVSYLYRWSYHYRQYIGAPRHPQGRPSLGNDKVKALCQQAEWINLRYDIGLKAAFEAAASRLGIERKHAKSVHDRFIRGRIRPEILK